MQYRMHAIYCGVSQNEMMGRELGSLLGLAMQQLQDPKVLEHLTAPILLVNRC